MTAIQSKALVKSFWISFGYVGLGTASLLSPYFTQSPPQFLQLIHALVLLLCLPVVIPGFAIMWGGGEQSHLYALIAQIVVFFGFWFFIYIDLFKNRLNELQIEDYNFIKETFEKWAQERDLKSKQFWQYTFRDNNRNSLIKFHEILKEHNFSLKEISQSEDDSWMLKLEIEEILTPEKLAKRNARLNKLIKQYNISSYEGWDLGTPA